MSPAPVKISRKHARTLLDYFRATTALDQGQHAAVVHLSDALRPPKNFRPQTISKAKAKKKALKTERTSKIWRAVEKRASGHCENQMCFAPFTDFTPPEMDHWHGKGREKETVQNCWMLCRLCHRAKGKRHKSPEWVAAFAKHCAQHGYRSEELRARARLESLELSAASEAAGKAAQP